MALVAIQLSSVLRLELSTITPMNEIIPPTRRQRCIHASKVRVVRLVPNQALSFIRQKKTGYKHGLDEVGFMHRGTTGRLARSAMTTPCSPCHARPCPRRRTLFGRHKCAARETLGQLELDASIQVFS